MNSKREKDELLIFSEYIKSDLSHNPVTLPSYKVLVVDDEEEVHRLTSLVLRDFSFEGRKLKLLNAYSAEEAKTILKENYDISLILLDVVMEEDDAGLRLVRFIRKEIKNKLVRIILRTGQPGIAPERDVISNYDINDYKEKTELTASKLFTSITSALRSYRDLVTIDNSRSDLKKVLSATSSLFNTKSEVAFAEDIFKQFELLFNVNGNSDFIFASSIDENMGLIGNYKVVYSAGGLSCILSKKLSEVLPDSGIELITKVCNNKKMLILDNIFVGYFETTNGRKNIFYLESKSNFKNIEQNIVGLFISNAGVAFDNLTLNLEITETQKSVVFMLGEAVEKRSQETGNHVKRMTEISCMLGRALGFSEYDIEYMEIGAPLHDIGKIAIADSILHKPGKLTSEEFEIMKAHTTEGYNILKSSSRSALQLAAIIARQHHERWNGNGYPLGLAGEEIHLFARIVALADVVDALGHKRCYKDAWSTDEIIEYLKSERGEHFDPKIVDAFMLNLDQYKVIYNEVN